MLGESALTRHIVLIIGMLWTCCCFSQAQEWKTIAPGLDYIRIHKPSISTYGRIHAFKVSLDTYKLGLAFAEDYNHDALSATKFASRTDSLIAINGGFFSPDFEPLGLRIEQSQQRNPLKKTSWWGVFYIKGKQANVVSQRQYHSLSLIHI